MGKRLKTLVVGLGHQSRDDHLPALDESDRFEISAVCDIDGVICQEVAEKYGAQCVLDLEEFLRSEPLNIDVALVAVPHQSYLPIIRALASKGIHIIKEKPFATSATEAREIVDIVKNSGVVLALTLQRRFNPVFVSFSQLVKRIGRVHAIDARYVMNVNRLDEGWRASRLFSGGGALIDLGYHYVDLIVWYFDLPDTVSCRTSLGNREQQQYDVEDTAFVQFVYEGTHASDGLVLGHLMVSRVFPEKEEGMTAFGTRGHVSVQRGSVRRVYDGGQSEERLDRKGSWPSALVDQLEACADRICDQEERGRVDHSYLKHVAFIEACYQSAKEKAPIRPKEIYNELRALMED